MDRIQEMGSALGDLDGKIPLESVDGSLQDEEVTKGEEEQTQLSRGLEAVPCMSSFPAKFPTKLTLL